MATETAQAEVEALTENEEFFALLALARLRKMSKRTRGVAGKWLVQVVTEGELASPVIDIPADLTFKRKESAIQGMIDRQCEKLEIGPFDVLELTEGHFVLIDWDAANAAEAQAKAALAK